MLILNFCGCLVLFVVSLPAVEDHSVKLAGLAVSMVLLGLGTGGIKTTISPFIGLPPFSSLSTNVVGFHTISEWIVLTFISIGYQYSIMTPQLVITKIR